MQAPGHFWPVGRAADVLEAGGVVPLTGSGTPEGFDSENFARRADGWVATSVTAGGATFRLEPVGLWARAVLRAVVQRHDLTDGQGAHLINRLGRDVPDALRNR